MRQDDFSFTPQFKLILAGNHRPQMRSLDDAMKRRLNLIPFTVKFDQSKRDIHLKDKLMQEADGILAWAVRGCVDWNTNGLNTPRAVTEATAEYFDDQDQIKHWAADCCEVAPNARGAAQGLYESFRSWCEDSGERFILPMKRFRQKLIDAGHEDMRTKQGKFFKGIKLADSMTMARGYQQDDMPGFN
jgi:putative DNA primase/helicase